MNCSILDLKHKEVVCVRDGSLLGQVCDLEIDTETAKVTAVIIYGKPRFFGILGREDDLIVSWSDIEVIGEDTILVNCNHIPHRNRGFFPMKTK